MIEIPKGKPKEDYQPIPSNLGSFMSQAANTEQVEEEPLTPSNEVPSDAPFEAPGNIEGNDGGMNWPPDDEEDHPGKKKVSRFTGDMMARFVDRLFANGAAMYTHGKISDYEASQKEMEEISESFMRWMEESEVEMSPTTTLVMSLTGIYMFRLPQLYMDRKHNLELEARKKSAEETANRVKNGGVIDVTAASTTAHSD